MTSKTRPIAPDEVLDLINRADRIEVVGKSQTYEASWFTGSPEEDERDGDALLIDNDDGAIDAAVSESDIADAAQLGDGSVLLQDGRTLKFYARLSS